MVEALRDRQIATGIFQKKLRHICFGIVAQAGLGENHEVRGILDKDQQYYFKIMAKKDKGGVRVQVNFYGLHCHCH